VPSRETIMNALLIALSGVTQFATVRRHMVPWPDNEPFPDPQPALYLNKPEERYIQGSNTPRKLILDCEAWVFAKIPALDPAQPGDVNRALAGETILNGYMDAIDVVFKDDPIRGRPTLGGLVSHCWIEGTVRMVSGDVDPNGQAFMSVPIHILVP
jgi:hypothetical protein